MGAKPTFAAEWTKQLAPIATLCNGILHRVTVKVPSYMTEPGRPHQERMVFFEAPSSSEALLHLQKLLATVWCLYTVDWCTPGYGCNDLRSAEAVLRSAFGTEETGELRLFETGHESRGGIIERIHYARAADVDVFVSPKAATRIRDLLESIELMHAAEPARLAAPPCGQ